MSSEPFATARLERTLRTLREKRERGDLTDKKFPAAVAEAIVEAFRDAVRGRLSQGEALVAEHHVARGHLKLSRSVLREPDEESVGIFLTDRRLFRVRATFTADGRPAEGVADALIDQVPLEHVSGLQRRRQVRISEVIAGAVVVAVALLLGPVLLLTGKLLVALGVLAILHGLLLPNRWFEVVVSGAAVEPPLLVLAPRKASGRALLQELRQRLGPGLAAAVTPPPVTAPATAAAQPALPPPAPSLLPLRVLIIDDETVFRDTLAKVLARRNIEAAVAAGGAEGLAHLAGAPCDVVVLDLRMPGMDGLQTLKRIHELRPGLPIILLTGHGTATAGLEAIREHAVNFLLKPVAPSRLILEIEAAAARVGPTKAA